jgi:hypothetical protein
LGNSEKLAVKHPVGPPIPALFQRSEYGSHIPSSVRRQESRDVFDNDEARLRAKLTKDSHELMEKP